MNSLPKSTARLHVLLARDAQYAVVIRRGPARRVCTIGWDRKTDTFKLGQWLAGRIHVHRSDISPDGTHLVYFAFNARWNSETRGSWTAVSRSPYLKAIGLWAEGDTWYGGGLFLDNRRVWLNGRNPDDAMRVPPRRSIIATSDTEFKASTNGEGLYRQRLKRDGWRSRGKQICGNDKFSVFERGIGTTWVLRKRCFFNSRRELPTDHEEHELVHIETGETIDKPEWEWADVDRRRLVWAEGGKLFAARLRGGGLSAVRELHDFNEMQFRAIPAPY